MLFPVVVEIGTARKPVSFELRSDGRFRVKGSALAKIGGDVCEIDGSIDVSESHCHLDGTLSYGNPNLLSLELAASGRFGPGKRFELAGAGSAKVLGMPLADVEGRVDERRLAISGRLDIDKWRPPGHDPLPIELDLRVAGSVELQQSLPNFRLTGNGRISLFDAEIASGRCGIECRPKKSKPGKLGGHEVLTWIEGALKWHGREWVNARIELGTDRFAVRGRTSLDFDITPPGAPLSLLLVLNFDASIGLGLPDGTLESLSARGDWLIGVRVGKKGDDEHIVPIAVGKLPQLAKANLPYVLIDFPGFALPKLDWEFQLPRPTLVAGDPITIPVPDATITLPALSKTPETKYANLLDPANWSTLFNQSFTYLTNVKYGDDDDPSTPTIDLFSGVPDIIVPTIADVDWDGEDSLPLPFDEVRGFTLVLDWNEAKRQFVILGELKSPPPKVLLEHDAKGIDIVGEFVSVVNDTAKDLNLDGWVLHAAASRQRRYKFPPITLKAGAEIKVWSKAGADDAKNLHWGRRQAVWNNTGDTVVLRNARGRVMVRVPVRSAKRPAAQRRRAPTFKTASRRTRPKSGRR